MKALLVFGSINMDVSVRVPRLPAPGETMMGSGLCMSPGGKGANQAHAARLFGARVTLAGAVGEDELARCALEQLYRSGVDLSALQRQRRLPTGVATINVTDAGENAIVVAPGANARLRASGVGDELLDAHHVLLLQGEVPMAESMALARRFKARGGCVILNLAPARELDPVDPACIDWLIVNQAELAALCTLPALADGPTDGPAVGPESGPEDLARVAARWDCKVVVTLGAAGALACLGAAGARACLGAAGAQASQASQADGGLLHVPALAIDVVDTTGAGDTFCGALAAALTLGYGPQAALRRAGVAASLACSRRGAQVAQPTRDDIERAVLAA